MLNGFGIVTDTPSVLLTTFKLVLEFESKDVVRHGLVQKIVEAYAKFAN